MNIVKVVPDRVLDANVVTVNDAGSEQDYIRWNHDSSWEYSEEKDGEVEYPGNMKSKTLERKYQEFIGNGKAFKYNGEKICVVCDYWSAVDYTVEIAYCRKRGVCTGANHECDVEIDAEDDLNG